MADGRSQAALTALLIVAAIGASWAARPNVVFMLAHDLGWNAVGCNGNEIDTPTIDRLADGGAKLYRYYPFPCCTSTQFAGMTRHSPLAVRDVGPDIVEAVLNPSGSTA